MGKIDFPVVGIGASAGGLKALQDFFDHLGSDNDMAFVVITHLAPQKTSAMDKLLAAHTSMDVQQVSDKTKVQPNHIYIIPPNKQLYLQEDQLLLAAKEKDTQAVVDVFFRSLAKECESLSIAIILSGTGSDGTLGLKAVKEYGGVTMAQDPREAEYDGMPRSAIQTDLVDFILPVAKLAKKVLDHKKMIGTVSVPLQPEELSQKEVNALNNIFGMLRSKKGHDFKHYKRSSVLRRLQRRMHVTKNKTIAKYQKYLKSNPDEITELFKDLLISVTNFFRDPEAFAALEKQGIPQLFENKKEDDPIRIWITGCATGEEVYSLAILLYEYAAGLDYMPQIKIFGTDISNEALKIARRGVYPETIATDVSPERLQRFFHKEEAGYRVSREIRERVLISNHDILSDPPFLKQDLIACRNMLIYFNQELQDEVLKILHYSLRPEGVLFLGMADSTIGSTDLFAPIDKSHGIYKSRKVPNSQKDIPHFPLLPNMHRSRSSKTHAANENELTFDKIHYTLLAGQYAPPSIIIDEYNQVMHSSRGVNRFLKYAEGEPTRNLLKMVSPDIQRTLRNIIFQFNKMETPTKVSKKVTLKEDSKSESFILSIRAIDIAEFPKDYRQITFEATDEAKAEPVQKKTPENLEGAEAELVEQLEEELEQTKEQLQQTVEEYETSNEELMASNEELQSMNEELQTTTEELETSKEELQSVNEELRTVNQELENKIDELQQANNDLKNLMEVTEIGIIFVDRKMNVKLYTENATNIFNLIESDHGRPLSDVTHTLQYDNLIPEIKQMFNDLKPVKKQVSTRDGDWYIIQLKPYKTTEYNVTGVVITFVDITDLKKAEEELTYHTRNEQSLAELGQFILKSKNKKLIFDEALKLLKNNLAVDYSVLMKINNNQNELSFLHSVGLPEKWNPPKPASLHSAVQTEIDYLLEYEEPVITQHFDEDQRFDCSKWVLDCGASSGIIVTVKGTKNLYGVLGIYSKQERSFTEHEVNFVQNTANMVGQAIERIQTLQKLKDAYHKLEKKIKAEQELQKEILKVEQEERWRLGQYLHDATAQDLLGIKILFDVIDTDLQQLDKKTKAELEKIKQLVVKSEKNIRELSHFILPIDNEENIRDALQKLINQTEELYQVKCTLNTDDNLIDIKDPKIASSVYYIAQEAIRNAINHGNADKINISLSADNGTIDLKVKDNGVGYDSQESGGGRGINIMKHRADLLGGSLKIIKTDSGGTLVTSTIPMGKMQ